MLAVSAWLPDEDRGRPPVVLVHGAANDGGVWTFWAARLAAEGWPTYVMYLRGHGMSDPLDLSRTSMGEYVDDVAQVVGAPAAAPGDCRLEYGRAGRDDRRRGPAWLRLRRDWRQHPGPVQWLTCR